MQFAETGLSGFCSSLASRDAVPGGGGASALAGALGAALASMVGKLTVGKPKYAQYEDEIQEILSQARALREKLLGLIDGDAEAFLPLSRAYAIPKDAPGRDEELERCLRLAAQAPLEILRCACQGIELHQRLEKKCSALALSDVGTGAVMCWAALYGAAMNVRVNTRLMKDRDYAAAVDAEVEALMNKYWKIADEVYESVWNSLK